MAKGGKKACPKCGKNFSDPHTLCPNCRKGK